MTNLVTAVHCTGVNQNSIAAKTGLSDFHYKFNYGDKGAKVKELQEELKEAKKHEFDSNIVKIYGENPETGKRSAGKLIASTLLIGLVPTIVLANKAEKIEMKRDIAELKGESETPRNSKEVKEELFTTVYAKDPETGKRTPAAGSLMLAAFPTGILIAKSADKMLEKQTEKAKTAELETRIEELEAKQIEVTDTTNTGEMNVSSNAITGIPPYLRPKLAELKAQHAAQAAQAEAVEETNAEE